LKEVDMWGYPVLHFFPLHYIGISRKWGAHTFPTNPTVTEEQGMCRC